MKPPSPVVIAIFEELRIKFDPPDLEQLSFPRFCFELGTMIGQLCDRSDISVDHGNEFENWLLDHQLQADDVAVVMEILAAIWKH